MELKKLDKSVLKLWYIRAVIGALALVGVFTSVAVILSATGATSGVMLVALLGVGIPAVLLLGLTLIIPALRYKMYAWGYDDKRIIVKQGVIFRKRVVIPVCQIQDLHRTQGPLMMMLNLSGVITSLVMHLKTNALSNEVKVHIPNNKLSEELEKLLIL